MRREAFDKECCARAGRGEECCALRAPSDCGGEKEGAPAAPSPPRARAPGANLRMADSCKWGACANAGCAQAVGRFELGERSATCKRAGPALLKPSRRTGKGVCVACYQAEARAMERGRAVQDNAAHAKQLDEVRRARMLRQADARGAAAKRARSDLLLEMELAAAEAKEDVIEEFHSGVTVLSPSPQSPSAAKSPMAPSPSLSSAGRSKSAQSRRPPSNVQPSVARSPSVGSTRPPLNDDTGRTPARRQFGDDWTNHVFRPPSTSKEAALPSRPAGSDKTTLPSAQAASSSQTPTSSAQTTTAGTQTDGPPPAAGPRQITVINIGTGIFEQPPSLRERAATSASAKIDIAVDLTNAAFDSQLQGIYAQRLAAVLPRVFYERINVDFRSMPRISQMELDCGDEGIIDEIVRVVRRVMKRDACVVADRLKEARQQDHYIVIVYDGGGMRGVVPAVFTEMVEKRIGQPLSQLVDLVVGTSIGGAGALAVALSTSCGEGPAKALELLNNLQTLFAAGRGSGPWPLSRSCLFDILPLVYGHGDELGPLLAAFGLDRETTLADLPPRPRNVPGVPARPRLVLLAATRPMQRGSEVGCGYVPYLLTNFDLPDALDRTGVWDASTSWPVWQAVQATSAAKTYFPAVEYEGTEYVDGGFALNNPSELAMQLASVLRGAMAD